MSRHILLASSATVEGIERLIVGYLCGGTWTVNPDTMEIRDDDGKELPAHFRVVKKGRRYRFEVEQ